VVAEDARSLIPAAGLVSGVVRPAARVLVHDALVAAALAKETAQAVEDLTADVAALEPSVTVTALKHVAAAQSHDVQAAPPPSQVNILSMPAPLSPPVPVPTVEQGAAVPAIVMVPQTPMSASAAVAFVPPGAVEEGAARRSS
jgi:hypothetical protein